jgi:GNAT superfamily N-acetyltransferase
VRGADAPRLGSGRAYEAARLRWAAEADAARLTRLWNEAREEEDAREEEGRMRAWLEHGGALLLEDAGGRPLCAVRWRWEGRGWRVDRIATRPEARGQGFGRWLMTKLEALAIKRNVPTLTLDLARPELLPYYRRLGYREEVEEAGGGHRTLVKQVGGTWQRQPGSAP